MSAGNDKIELELEEYLSQVRHDIRVHLTVMNEGISMVLDGLGKKDCEKCFYLLKIALDHVEQVNELTKNMLSSSTFKSKVSGIKKK